MNVLSKWVTTLGLLSGLMLAATVDAAPISGTFSGIVVAGGYGTIGTLDASTVAAGSPVYGTFSYDPQIFQSGGLNGNGYFIATGSTNPVVISATVAGSTFTVHGTIQSVLDIVALPSSQNPNNHFYIEAANWGPSVPGLSGSVDLNLNNYLGAPFASNINDSSSVAFTHQSGVGISDLNTLQAIDSGGTGTAALYFTIIDASTSVAPAALLDALLKEVTGVKPEGLADKVEHAQRHIEATCTALSEFVSQVQQQNGNKIASQLAAKLIADAQAIKTSFSCN
jgi:hypothetical protein